MRKNIFLSILLFASLSIYSQTHRNNSIDQIKELITSQEFESAKQLADSLLLNTNPDSNPIVFLRATSVLILANVKIGSFSEGVRIGDKLLTDHPNLIGINAYASSEFYSYLGEAYTLTQSNTKKALSYFNQALSFYKKLDSSDPKLKVFILRGIGRTNYYMEEYENSIIYLEEAQAILDRLENPENIAINFRSIGNTYWGMKDYEKAAANYSKSLEVLFKQDLIDSLKVGQVLHAMGYIYMDQEAFQKAYETFALASQLLSQKHAKVSSPMVWIYGDVGRSLIELKKYDSALVWLQKALNANVFEYQQSDYHINPPLTDLNDDFQHFMILKLKGQAFLKKYIQSGDVRDLEGMIDSFLQSDEQVDNIRSSIPKAEDQSTIAYYSTEIHSTAIDAFLDIYKRTTEKRYLEIAHYFMEKRKITNVHLKFLEASAKSKKILPTSMLSRDQELLNEISSLKTELRRQMTVNSDSVDILKQKLFVVQESYESFISEIKKSYPSYHAARFDLEVKSAVEVQQFLNDHHPNRSIVTYYNFGGKLRVSVLTKDTLFMDVIRHDSDFDELAQNFRKKLTDPESEASANDALNQILIDPIRPLLKNDIQQITFILDPALQLIPMELMRLDETFLFEHFDISYHFSATLFASKQSQNAKDVYSGFAPSFDSLSLISLPGAKEEVKNISNVFGGAIFTDDEADEKTFKGQAKKSSLIHLATHAVVDEQNPESSYLQFSPNADNLEDNRLHFFEIYNLQLDAQLITLSACNTGYGKVQKGEGVMSLSRAFAYAGVPATVVSLWPASDKSTPELMKFFYQNLKEGQAKDIAINNARKQYLATAKGKARHPFYWGGFVLIGENSPIDESRNLLVWMFPITIILVLIGTVYRRRKSKLP